MSAPPRLVIAGAGSGVGKTVIATGLMSRLSRDRRVQGYKVGPDFIDPMYHAAATDRPSRNLDSFFMDRGTLINLFGWSSRDADLAVVEGVRGLYDGLTATGDTGSTAEIAKFIRAPVVLVVNARSLAKSAAAHVLGFKMLDPGVNIEAVILNNISGDRHRRKAVEAVESLTGIEVVGTIERQRERLPERHLGLMTMDEAGDAGALMRRMEELVADVDVGRLMEIARSAPQMEMPTAPPFEVQEAKGITMAVPRDRSFCFYYQENLEALRAAGAEVVTFRPTDGEGLPDCDGVYMGGGYPEVHAERLASNGDFLDGLRQLSEDGGLVNGECGGMMAMCRSISAFGREHRMAGIFDARATLTPDRQGLAYVEAKGTGDNFLFPGTDIRAHEFHYSKLEPLPPGPYGFSVLRGTGIGASMDGIMVRRSMGTYMHQHALANRAWGTSMVRVAAEGRS
ncbi:MAG: hydrogenobyrinic acid a,c-diamide synthase (glutamine-hydrolyzing) [Methanomassiliicoccus sp.]|nr:hydrogenobyrinic acid a,c-diamide synthase (glutamine-hydrolyzing) [Methanomassiliicoccus sp.]